MSVGKLPAFQFYPGDWMKDPALRGCSIAARGLWMDVLCLMFESVRRGYLQHATGKPVTAEQLARMTGCSTDEVSRLLQELEDSGVFSRTEHGAIYSRRQVRDENKRRLCAEAGKKGGNPILLDATLKGRSKGRSKGVSKGRPKGEITPSSSSSSSSSSSKENIENNEVAPSRIPDSEPNICVFDCSGDPKTWGLKQRFVSELSQAYPAVDVLAEARRAKIWCDTNPAKRKTAAGMGRFLATWMSRVQDKGGNRPPSSAPGAAPQRRVCEY